MNNKALAAIALMIIVCAPIGLGYLLNTEDVDYGTWKRGGMTQINDYVNQDRENTYTNYTGIMNNYYGFYNTPSPSGKSGLAQLDFVSVTSNPSSYPVRGDGTPEIITYSGGDLDLGSYGGDNYKVAFDINKGFNLDIGMIGGGGMGYTQPAVSGSSDPAVHIIKQGSNLYIDDTLYPDVASVTFSSTNTGFTVTITPIDTLIGYADVTKGWYVDPYVNLAWYNSQSINTPNYGAVFMVEMPTNTEFYMFGSNVSLTNTHFIRDASGEVTVQQTKNGSILPTEILGNYQYIMIDCNRFDPPEISGIAAWPQMGIVPEKLNTITPNEPIDYLFHIMTTSSDIHFRVDMSMILDKTVPITTNTTVYVNGIKPNMTSYDLELQDVVKAGDSIGFNGTMYRVVGNKLIINDFRTIDIIGKTITISSRSSDNVTWNNYINGILVSNSASMSDVTLNGTWGVSSYNLYGLTIEHKIKQEWMPGGFDFDTSALSIIGLAACAAAFVILGLTGARSGGKIIWLAVICGGGALVFLFMV